MRAVWKFPLELTAAPQGVVMPKGAIVVHVHEQNQRPALWAAVDPNAPKVGRTFSVFATGEEITLPVHRYVGTVHIDWTVWHVYEDVAA